jgi:general secretion pathway protein G
MKRMPHGFTLIELMVVVIIIAALAGMVLPRLLPASDSAKRKIARGDVANITVAIKLYRLHNDRYPTTDEGVDILLAPSTSKDWKEPFLDRKPIDPWGRKYQYRYPGTRNTAGFDLWSMGPDGKDGTDDDVSNWQD